MTTTIFLARFWGWLTVLMTVIYFVRPQVLLTVKRLMVENRPFALMYGFLSLMLGLASVIVHNVWMLGWPTVVTLFGWACLVKGILVLAYPEISQKPTFEFRVASTRASLAVAFALAAWLIFMSTRPALS